jgi:hypothetical protein
MVPWKRERLNVGATIGMPERDQQEEQVMQSSESLVSPIAASNVEPRSTAVFELAERRS